MKKTNASILILDDQEHILFTVKMLLKKYFQSVNTLSDPSKLLPFLSENEVNVILLDMNYRLGYEDGREGMYYLKEILEHSTVTKVILMTAFGKIETAVEGIKLGAFDYILKPWDNDKFIEIIKKAVVESRKLGGVPDEGIQGPAFFKGNDDVVVKAYSLAEKVAKTDANVLILGENGTGKFVFAKHIHDHSERRNNPFVHVDLGSLSESLFESELFGYSKGAFTDAKTDSPGRFEHAAGGTIFLDEIGNVPLHLQSKLLQVIQSKKVVRIGENKSRDLDVRIIAATNLNLEEEVQKRRFRQDLYYRINTVKFTLPPLRERQDDIIPLTEFFIEKMGLKYHKSELKIAEPVIAALQKYQWKGNIRELENKIERAVIVCENELIRLEDLDLEPANLNEMIARGSQLSDIERKSIEKVLKKHENNVTKAAQELGLSRAALYRRMEKFDIKNN